MSGRPERNEWDQFTEVAWDKKGRCVQVQCKHCPWRGSHHATRCALHYAKRHAHKNYQSDDPSSPDSGMNVFFALFKLFPTCL